MAGVERLVAAEAVSAFKALATEAPAVVKVAEPVVVKALGETVAVTAKGLAKPIVTFAEATENPAMAVLQRVKDLKKVGVSGTVIFDLDDTLFRAAPRTARILQEWAKTPLGKPYASGIAKLGLTDLGYELEPALTKAGVPSKLHAGAKQFYLDRFFDNGYLKFDKAIPGGAAYVRRLHREGASIVYVTGRWEGLRSGSAAMLKKGGFPLGNRAELVMKQEHMATSAFKGQIADRLKVTRTVVGTFDNETANTNMFRSKLPQAINTWLDTSQPLDSPQLLAGTRVLKRYPRVAATGAVSRGIGRHFRR